MLLVFRGVTGLVVHPVCPYQLLNHRISFIGLNGTYFSLQYLSLSDATVLSFLVPMCTAISGSFFLKEVFTKREALAGRECLCFMPNPCSSSRTVCSLFGVVLIARPEFLFGTPNGSTAIEEKHRMMAIGCAMIQTYHERPEFNFPSG
jgi:hypothetical protein